MGAGKSQPLAEAAEAVEAEKQGRVESAGAEKQAPVDVVFGPKVLEPGTAKIGGKSTGAAPAGKGAPLVGVVFGPKVLEAGQAKIGGGTTGAAPAGKGALLGMGNPLLDISAEVDQGILEKYGLKAGDAILAEEKHQPLFVEMAKLPNVQYIAGGATQNTIRVAQWMLQEPGATAYMGCVGADQNGDKLKQACATDGVQALYMVDQKTPTGTCATLITGIERSLCTNLNAANNYKVDHCKAADNWKVVQGAKIVYSAGFFATVSPEAIEAVSAEKAKDGGIYCMNLSAPFLMQVPPFKAAFTETMPLVDFLFGNETEARTWAEVDGWETTDVQFIATRLSLIPSAKGRKRTVVITQGCDPTVVCVNGICTLHPIIALPKEKLVDTNGAGDSYVGGFLAGLAKGLPAKECCRAGAYAASVIVQQSGCTFPPSPSFAW